MHEALSNPSIAFVGHQRLAAGPLHEVALAVKAATDLGTAPIFIYDDATGQVIDLDTRGTRNKLWSASSNGSHLNRRRGRASRTGRPKLGVVAREKSLLPRHWDWLSTQPGGASVALRKLVEQARKTSGEATGGVLPRKRHTVSCRSLAAICLASRKPPELCSPTTGAGSAISSPHGRKMCVIMPD